VVNRAVARRLLTHAAGARGYLIAAGMCGLAVTGLILAQAQLLARALAGAATGAAATMALRGTLLALLVVVIARAVAVHAGEATALRGAVAIKERLRSRLARHVLTLGPSWLGRQRPGEIATLGTSGLDSLDPYFARYMPQVVLAAAVPVAVLATVTAADWVSGLIIAVTMPLIPVFAALVGLRTKAQAARSWQLLAKLSGHFLDVVQGLPTLKLFGRTAAEERVIAETTMCYRASVLSTLKVAFLSALVLELSASLATALVAVEVGLRLLYGHMSYQTALLVLLLTPEAYLPLRNLAAHYHASADGMAAAERVFAILDTPLSPVAALRDSIPVPDVRSKPISFNGTTVVYQDRREPAIAGLRLTVAPGDRIDMTGDNGAGKTTLLSLLLRFIEPTAGVIDVGGVGLDAIPADRWREQVGWLPQHPTLFAWSVAENIALGRPGAPRTEVERAATLAGAGEFIGRLRQGYDTVLDERAQQLSAGQRQKIALARLFLREAPLLLLDEPTAHLDPASAADVAAAIGILAAGRTVIVVTHRDAELFRAALSGCASRAEARSRAWVDHPSPESAMSGPPIPGPGIAGPGIAGPGIAGPGIAGPGIAGPGIAGPGIAGPAVRVLRVAHGGVTELPPAEFPTLSEVRA
jgi:ATP-binding cassette, subfamily C, bacterial CydD